MNKSNQRPIPDEHISARLAALVSKVDAGEDLSYDDLAFVEHVAGLLDSAETMNVENGPARVRQLADCWKRGSRFTAAALHAAYVAEQEGDIAGAVRILSSACAQISMPFYIGVLQDALARLQAR